MSDDVYGFVSTQADATPFTGVVAPSYPALSTAVSSLTAASLSKKITEMASAMNSTGVSTQKLTSYQTVSTSTLTGGSDTITLSDGTTFTSASVTGATVSSSSVTANMANSVGAGAVTDTDDYKFSLTNQQTGEVIVFDVMPQVNENRNVEYEAVAPPQFPGAFQKYRGTSSTTWQVNITLISRVVGVKRIEEEVTYGGGTFKRRKVFLFMIQYLCPIFAGIILLSSVANAFGWISM
jgi:hypothetical protein